jgi:hypothetical protein
VEHPEQIWYSIEDRWLIPEEEYSRRDDPTSWREMT